MNPDPGFQIPQERYTLSQGLVIEHTESHGARFIRAGSRVTPPSHSDPQAWQQSSCVCLMLGWFGVAPLSLSSVYEGVSSAPSMPGCWTCDRHPSELAEGPPNLVQNTQNIRLHPGPMNQSLQGRGLGILTRGHQSRRNPGSFSSFLLW